MKWAKTKEQLLSEANKIEREIHILSRQSMAGMKGQEVLDRSTQIQRLCNRVAALRKKARER